MDVTVRVRENMESVRRVLRVAGSVLSAQTIQSAAARLDEIEERLSGCAGPLHVGLLGGTGVGKSTLINALAEDEISSASDRRPHTDRIVVYRHREQVWDDLESDLVIQPHRTHDRESIRNLVLYDLPDFDSIMEQNRERVLGFLGRLDVVCWVTTPEKYADQAFLDVLRRSPHHPGNFFFALNKTDLLIGGDGEPDESKIAAVVDDLRNNLKRWGVPEPEIYAMSALRALERRAGAGDFPRFRDTLFRARKDKEVRAIKLANVEQELQSVIREVRGTTPLRDLLKTLSGTEQRLEKDFEDIRTAGGLLAEVSLDHSTRSALRSLWLGREKHGGLVTGLLKGMMSFQTALRFRRQEGMGRLLFLDDDLMKGLVNKIETARNRAMASLARFPLPEGAWRGSTDAHELPQRLQGVRDDWTARIHAWASSGPPSGWRWRLRLLKNRVTLWAPLLLLVLYLMDPRLVQQFGGQPSIGLLFQMLSGVFFSLFQPKGIVALLSFLLMEAVLAGILARATLRSLDARIEQFCGLLLGRYKAEVGDLLGEYEQELKNTLMRLRQGAVELEGLQSEETMGSSV